MKNRLLKSKSHANRYMIETCLNLLEKWEKFQPLQKKSSKWYFILNAFQTKMGFSKTSIFR